MLPAKYINVWLPRKCNYRTNTHMDIQTPEKRSRKRTFKKPRPFYVYVRCLTYVKRIMNVDETCYSIHALVKNVRFIHVALFSRISDRLWVYSGYHNLELFSGYSTIIKLGRCIGRQVHDCGSMKYVNLLILSIKAISEVPSFY